MELFFTSDQHYFHRNIMLYDQRPFGSVEEMNQVMIDRHNSVVSPNDEVYIIGDFSFGTKIQTETVLKQLRGKLFLIKGNHDKIMKKESIRSYFKWIRDYHEINLIKRKDLFLVLSHYPFASWNRMHKGSIHLHGHTHETQKITGQRRYNVSVVANDYKPVSLEDILQKISPEKSET